MTLAHDGTMVPTRQRHLVPMPDGVRLATDVYLPPLDAGGSLPRPVVLERTPYGIRNLRASDGTHSGGRPVTPDSGAAILVAAGYAVVRQDCRGRGASEGRFTKYTGEVEDGVATHEWILRQPWCDGRIATIGVSYSAHTQAATASLGAPGLAAMILDSGGFASAYCSGGRLGGAFELKQVTWALRHARQSPEVRADPVLADRLARVDLAAWFTRLPWHRGDSPLTGAAAYEDFLFDQWEHETLDAYWRRPGLHARDYYDAFPVVPSLHISSWYDPYVRTAVENATELRRRGAPTGLILGPWTHGARSVTYAGDVDFGPAATRDAGLGRDYPSYRAAWLDHAVRREPSRPAAPPAGAASTAASAAASTAEPQGSAAMTFVRYFVMGGGDGRRGSDGRMRHGGQWRDAHRWPPEQTQRRTLHLGPGSLGETRARRGATVTYDYDPAHPTPSVGGAITSGEPLMRGGAFDQVVPGPDGAVLPLCARPDVVTFRTAPLAREVVLAGSVTAVLTVSTSVPDTDLAVKLVDEHPPTADYPAGYAMNVTDGLLRLRFRESFERPVLLEPHRAYEVRVVLPDVANRFVAGHRIRLDVTSSNFPRCDVNPNTGDPVAHDARRRVARTTLHLAASRLEFDALP